MTQQEFGELLGVDRRTIINYEQGKPIPTSKKIILEMIINNNGILPTALSKNEKPTIPKDIIIGDIENLRREILDHKDHIKTLKELIEERL